MPNTYVALATQTLSTAASTITFSSIPQGYTDLVLVFQATGASANMNWDIRVGNGTVDSGSNYSATYLVGGSGGASSNRVSNQTAMRLGFSAYIQASGGNFIAVTQIMNYSNTTTNKTVISRDGNVNLAVEAAVGLWRSTSAINIITLGDFGGATMAIGTTATLYGVANADQGAAKATGGIITEDSQYWYHTFGASGAFIPKQSLTCDVLVVAGGGGGAGGRGGGGGAGGFRTSTGLSLTIQNYAVTVGAGGTAAPNGTVNASNGSDSVFSSITSTGGGGGGRVTQNGLSGGSGSGGGGADNTGVTSGGAASPSGQGNAGGNGYQQVSAARGGGGGGAGVAGTAGTSGNAGNGGNGLTNSYSGLSVTYAGGGGGGYDNRTPATQAIGGTGGGGNGGSNSAGFAGTVNLGGGGGAGCLITPSFADVAGGNGGSGIVIVRYAK